MPESDNFADIFPIKDLDDILGEEAGKIRLPVQRLAGSTISETVRH